MPASPSKPQPEHLCGDRTMAHSRDSKEFHAAHLFGDAREIVIRHEGERYRLRRTSKGKLILTK